jgi:integrase
VNGTELRKSLGSHYPEARRLASLEDARIRRRKAAGMDPREPTVSEFGETWKRLYVGRRRNPKGRELAAQRLRDFVLPAIGSLRLSEVRAQDLEEIVVSLSGRLSAQSVRHVMADLRCLLGYAVRRDALAKSPWAPELMPRQIEQLPRALTDEQLRAVIAASEGRSSQALIIRLLVTTGIRWGELHRLTWHDVRLDPPACLELERTKSKRVRRVPLPSEAVELLREERARQQASETPSIHVLATRTKNPCSWVTRNRTRSGVHWTVHQLRHTFAVRYLQGGGSLAVLQQILGHSTVLMTQRYSQLSEAFVMSEAARIDLRSERA